MAAARLRPAAGSSGLATAGIVLGIVFTCLGLRMVLTGDVSHDFSTSP